MEILIPMNQSYFSAVSGIVCIINTYNAGYFNGYICVDPRKFCQRWSNFDKAFFLIDEGREDPNTTINASEKPFKWRANHDLTLNADR